jgi:hypothetical protein
MLRPEENWCRTRVVQSLLLDWTPSGMWVTARGWGNVYVSNTNMAVGKDRSCARRHDSNPSPSLWLSGRSVKLASDLHIGTSAAGLYGLYG